ncbi:hypothetical protein NP233_g12231 [Leucocoprinus birnbaumii]|uniref:Uncharacterized protein n=1 Tax=Leucocoprinus birnbaumii TaxID=56174 RepID=A0AAD5VEZ3_9AGAR|nr:hypothetical protein NP233_g12231 [Leucocoprinus birnbaumii]
MYDLDISLIFNGQRHKPVCKVNVAQAAQLAAADKLKDLIGHYPSSLPQNPNKISFVELDAKLEQWVKHFGPTLMYSTIHALKLPLHFPRARTHLLRVSVAYNENNAGESDVGRFFDLDEVEVMSLESVAEIDKACKMSVDQLKTMREESESNGRGVVVATAVFCSPLAVQIVPFGSITGPHMKRIKWIENWEKNLRRCIETGNPSFGSV